jgi:hypothetical protein
MPGKPTSAAVVSRSLPGLVIRDKALAIEMYARQAQNTEVERQACETRLRAGRECRQLLSEQVKRGERQTRLAVIGDHPRRTRGWNWTT